MSYENEWEQLYTESKIDEDLVDLISINADEKEYLIELNAPSMVTDGEDDEGNQIYSSYISRFTFDLIVKALKESELSGEEYDCLEDEED